MLKTLDKISIFVYDIVNKLGDWLDNKWPGGPSFKKPASLFVAFFLMIFLVFAMPFAFWYDKRDLWEDDDNGSDQRIYAYYGDEIGINWKREGF